MGDAGVEEEGGGEVVKEEGPESGSALDECDGCAVFEGRGPGAGAGGGAGGEAADGEEGGVSGSESEDRGERSGCAADVVGLCAGPASCERACAGGDDVVGVSPEVEAEVGGGPCAGLVVGFAEGVAVDVPAASYAEGEGDAVLGGDGEGVGACGVEGDACGGAGEVVYGVAEPEPGRVEDLAVPGHAFGAEREGGGGAPAAVEDVGAEGEGVFALDDGPDRGGGGADEADVFPLASESELERGVAEPGVLVVEGSGGAAVLEVGGEPGGSRYSPLAQIDRHNVHHLEVAWTYRTSDADPARFSTIECTPIVVDGILYATTCSPRVKVVALDAATGREKWRYDPFANGPPNPIVASGGVNRGVAYWSDGRPGGERRILHGTADGRLISLDARTGRPDPAFGDGGVVDLRAGITERDLRRLPYGTTSAPAVFADLVILGFSNGEGPGPTAPGDIRAFDVRTGREVWRFHTVPRPGEFGNDTWEGDSWRDRGGANPWGGFTLDPRRGILFCGTGSPAFDFYGGDRKGEIGRAHV